MSAVLRAKSRIRALSTELTELQTARLSVKNKNLRMDEIETELKGLTDTIATHERAQSLMVGGDALGFDSASANPPCFSAGGPTGQRVAPVTVPEHVMKGLHQAVMSHQSLKVDTKAADTLTGYVPPILGPTLGRIAEPTRIASLFPAVSLSAPVIEYPRITGQTGAAAVVAPGGLKPLIDLTTDLVTAHAAKIAGLLRVQDESLQDFPNFSGVVTTELQRAITSAENTELLLGDGTTGHMDGLLHQAGLTRTATTGETVLDVLEQGMTDLRNGAAFAQPDGIAMNPTDWSAMRRLKDSQNRYLLTPDPTADVTPSLWGCSVILTTDMPAGTAVVGAFQLGGVLHVRQGMTVEVNNRSDQDWTHNTSTFRAELREALAILRPAAFNRVSLTPAA